LTPEQQFRGVYVIVCTPFDDYGNLDEESLRQEIQFCLAAGVHGIVAPANASEVWTLTDEERRRVVELVLAEVRGRIPVIVGVTAGSAHAATILAKEAEAAGASALMAAPPSGRVAPLATIYDYYRALSAAVPLPIFIQNCDPPGGVRLNAAFIGRLVNEIEHVDYIKEEIDPPGPAISADIVACGGRLKGIMGGLIGRYVLDEYQRGTCGTMPACEVADINVQIWEALEAGDGAAARSLFSCLLPLLNYEASYRVAIYKEVLRRRGIIRTSYLRSTGGDSLDAQTHRELDLILSDLSPRLHLAPPSPHH
jgi:4-hydroxy-tetrahydrodipicolinate synthase